MKNFQLLAQRYHVEMAKAYTIQARLWNNPVVSYENVLYNPNTKRPFDFSDESGEIMASVQQLIRTAGKRSKLVGLAEFNQELESLAFEDLLRILKFQLYFDYALIYTDLKKLNLLRAEEQRLIKLLEASKLQYELGAISGYERTRIEYEVAAIRLSLNDIFIELSDKQAELKAMLQLDAAKFIVPAALKVTSSAAIAYSAILDSALVNRPDLKSSKTDYMYQRENLSLQRANAVPDVLLGTVYDRYGGAFKNYLGINVGVAIPAFNRNQGYIKAAELQTDLSEKEINYTKLLVEQEVQNGYNKYLFSAQLFQSVDSTYRKNLEGISAEAVKKYQERLIGLLDFIDKIRTYKNAMVDLLDIELNYFVNTQNLNYVTNSKIVAR